MAANLGKDHKRLYRLRRLAIQIASQLPENNSDAIMALRFTEDLVNEFLGKSEAPHSRAGKLALIK